MKQSCIGFCVLFFLFFGFWCKWDGLENKTTVVIYGGGAIVAVWLSSILVGAINSVPLVSKPFMDIREKCNGDLC